ncbi:MAG: hypothetical protein ACAF41_11955 [Leptolyngbya sp. BL-A-14]
MERVSGLRARINADRMGFAFWYCAWALVAIAPVILSLRTRLGKLGIGFETFPPDGGKPN